MKFKFAKDVKDSNERKESRSLAFVLFLIIIMCCAWIAPSYLFADPAASVQENTIPPELRKKEQPTKKPPLPSQLFGLAPDPTKVLHLPPIDMEKIQAEDKANLNSNKPGRDAIVRPVDASPYSYGEWFDISDGKGSIWFFQIHSPFAVGINVHFADVNLPKGARIYVYSPLDPDNYVGPYRGGPKIFSKLIVGDTVIIEFLIPTPYTPGSEPPFIIKEIGHMYRELSSTIYSEPSIIPLVADCHNDPTCSPYSA